MKKNVSLLLIGIALIFTGCAQNTYSSLRDQEDKLIANYISRKGLHIITEEPDINYKWGEKDYYKVTGVDNLYFHLISRGDSIRVDSISPKKKDTVQLNIIMNDVIITRYKRFDLTEYTDTLSNWTTLDNPYAYEFHYGNTDDCEATAWHLAVRLMQYPNSQCELIVPSKLGFTDAQTSVTPYVYIMKIAVKP